MVDKAIAGFSLSPQQKHLWLLMQESADSFRSRCTVFLRGELDREKLKASLADVAARYEVLRTVFPCPSGLSLPLQVIREAGWDLREEDLTGCLPAEWDEGLDRLRDCLAGDPLDLAHEPLWRAALVRLAPREHAFLVEVPALCADRRGLAILMREIARSYTALTGGRASAREPVQYIDLSEWQNDLLLAEDTRQGREHWRKSGTAAPPPLSLPFRLAADTDGAPFQPRVVGVALDPGLWGELRSLAGREQTDLQSVLLAAWAVLLARLTSCEEQGIGLVTDGRNFSELAEAVGLFSRCLPLSFAVVAHRSFAEVLREVSEDVREAVRRQQYFSWEYWEGGPQTAAGVPYPAVAFEFAEIPEPIAAAGVMLSLARAESTSERFRLKLTCSVGDGAAAEIGFDAALFREEDVRQLAEGLATVLTGAITDSAGAVGDLEILGLRERARCVVEFNQPEPAQPPAVDLCALFDRQAEAHPETLAVVAGEQSLTYRELADRANRLGHHLRRLGIGPEVSVALCLDRSVEMIVSLLGVLKAGGVYVPLDPVMPQDRLELMVADAGARVLVVHGRTSPLLPAAPAVRLDLGAAAAALAAESPEAPPSIVDPDNLAYVIYTSGSTGRPKGVAISRGQLASYVQAVSRRLDLPEGAGYALISTFAADLGNTVLYPALAGGGCLHVLTQEHASDAAALAAYAGRHAIDCLKIVPSHLRALLDGPRPESVLPRHCLVLGGEATDWDLLARIQELAPGCRVMNHYGPTETTVGVLTCTAARGWRDPDAAILPLGRPLSNSRIYVVDARLRAVPGWVPGEVLIGGEGVARGYVGHPSLTAERFVPDPFAQSPGQRLYRTGDLARHLPSGLLEFLGRGDDQVKIRGFRVELGEIVCVLSGHPALREAAVLARDEEGGGKRLVAYVVPVRGERGEGTSPDELRSWLRQQLPDYMVPAAFVSLEALPLTPNGKLDRRALPALELSPASAAEGGVPPSPAEEILIGIWSDLLGTAQIGLRDSFFELGGHSLLATQLISRVRDAFDVELPLHVLFAAPTVAGLADRVAAAGRPGPAVAPPIDRVPREGDLPLSFAQQRLWFLDRFEPGSPFYNITRALRLRGLLDVRSLGRTLREIVRRHETLRTTFPSSGGLPVQVIAAVGDASLLMVDLGGLGTAEREAAVADLATLWARRPFDLAAGPLLRAGLLRLDEVEHVLLLSLHHIVSDGWSMRVLFRELKLLYEAYAAGAPSPLPELPVQYADFAAWQRVWLEGEALEGELAYWRDRLAGAPAVLTLPADRPRPRVQGFRGGAMTRWMPVGLNAGLRRIALREGATFFMVALTAYEVLLHRLSGQSDVCVGTPIAGRSRSETEGIIGLFANTLVLRGRLGDEPAFCAALGRSRSEVLGAHAHQDLPFEKLVEELQPERDPGHTPLFQVMLVVQEDHREPWRLADLELAPLPANTGTAKCDLILGIADTGAGLRVTAEHNLDLFDAPTVARMLEQLAALLAGIAAAPETPVGELPLLDPVQRHQILVEANDSRAAFPDSRSIPDLFEAQATRAAEAVALEWEGGEMTYGELSHRANRLAHHLAALGVGLETRVGVCLDRSPDLVVSLLAILKTGGVYVPLDRSYPRERLLSMMRDARVPLVLTLEGLTADLPETGARHLCLDREVTVIAQRSSAAPRHAAGPETLAYISFTSGSTGRPKGVEVPHRGVLRLLFGVEYVNLGPTETLLQLSPVSFDASTFEIWGALLHGGRCVLPPPGIPSPSDLGFTLRAREITTLWLTSSLYNAVIDEAPASLAGVRQLLVGGEALSVEHVRRGLALLPDTRIINGYGPTECTTFTCCHPVARDLAAATVSIPIGRPIANTQVHVLDRGREPVPAGVSGELWIGGAGLARGYAGRPELTASAFLPDPFSAVPGARLYRTGDLVRRRLDGVVEYLGRLDHQVKVRGFRIELEEIETVLHRQPGVRGAVVVVRQDALGEKRLVAYVVLAEGGQTDVSALLDFLRGILPVYMIPSAFVLLPALPLTPTGKVDRAALPDPDGARPELAASYVEPSSEMERALAEIWREVLQVDRVGVHDNFFDLGGHSLLLIRVHDRIREQIDRGVQMIVLFQFPTLRALSEHLRPSFGAPQPEPGKAGRARERREARSHGDSDIAIIGMSGRFPGARDVEHLWRNLCDGVESITFFTKDEQLGKGVDPAVVADPAYVPAAGMLDGIDRFDASFFGVSPREAELMDPQQRLFLEHAWEALESAGYAPESSAAVIGVFAGISLNDYLLSLLDNPGVMANAGSHQLRIGNDKDFLPLRVSYKLNLRGPSINVQSACSTSLVAVHLACQSLLAGECDIALAGGVSASARQGQGYLYAEGGIASPDGHCRAFDARAQGIVSGNGVGIVTLKRLHLALADGDHIHAVVKGSAVNNDGSGKVGFTAPSLESQSEVVAEALAVAGVAPETVGYVEAHGTGTVLGDPIEIAALTRAFRAGTDRTGYCAVGSVKTNLGHLDAAAGVTGLIKAALTLERGRIPPSLHFEEPNPEIDFAGSPFYVNSTLADWSAGETPRRAGVSALGVGGTNAHVVLEEAPPRVTAAPTRPAEVLVLSARTATALEAATTCLADHLERHPELGLADVAFTLQVGRRHFEHRRALVCSAPVEAVEILRSRDPRRVVTTGHGGKERKTAFLFPGQGAQILRMGMELHAVEPEFRRELDRCAELLAPELGLNLRELLAPPPERAGQATAQLQETSITQPVLFSVEYALARLWMSWGVRPAAMIGHSLGEYVAACLAEVFTLEEALSLVALRGRMMQELPTGAMLGVSLAEKDVLMLLKGSLSLASVNGPSRCVVSGPEVEVRSLEERLTASGVAVSRIAASHAFHSAMMDPILEQFATEVARFRPRPPRLPYISNVTGSWITSEQATDPAWWAAHLRQPVRFADGLDRLLEDPDRILLEVGPGATLTALARRHPRFTASRVAVVSLPQPGEAGSETLSALAALGRLWAEGVVINWAAVQSAEPRRRVVLPTYPFERERFWIEPLRTSGAVGSRGARALRKSPEVRDWFYLPSWKPAPLAAPVAPGSDGRECLVLAGRTGLGRKLADRLAAQGWRVTVAMPGERLAEMVAALRRRESAPCRIIHAWALEPCSSFEEAQALGLYSLLALSRALAAGGDAAPTRVLVLTAAAWIVTGDEKAAPAWATLPAACRVIFQEEPRLSFRCVDVVLPEADSVRESWLTERLAAELAALEDDAPDQSVVAWRGRRRFAQTFEPVRPVVPEGEMPLLRPQGVYLISGGLGGVGLVLAEHLARSVQARLVLVGRTGLEGNCDEGSRRMQKIRELEALGAEVLVLRADVADRAAMREVVSETLRRFGALHGVLHGAGVTGEKVVRPFQETGPEECGVHFRPKAHGLLVLEEVLAGLKLDFCLLLSSLSAVLGGLGFSAYAAANAFMDAFAEDRSRDSFFPWISVDWDGWRLRGRGWHGGFGAAQADLAMAPEEGAEAFRLALALPGESRIVVSTAELRPRMEQWLQRLAPSHSGSGEAASITLHRRPELPTPYVAPRDAIEESVARVWRELLGIEKIGVHDDFFELRGDSLLATQMMSRLRQELRLDLPLRSLFEDPTVAGIAEQAVRARQGESRAAAAFGRVSRDDDLVTSFAQHRLWFLSQLHPDSPAYNLRIAVRLRGPLDVPSFGRTLNEIVRRHEVLRTSFTDRDGEPVQVIAPPLPLPLPVIDLRALPEASREAEVHRRLAEESSRPFDLSQVPLLRSGLFMMGADDHVLPFTMHHIVSDGWSMAVLTREVVTLYEKLVQGQASSLPELAVQYADFAAWQRAWLQGEELEIQLDYWKRQLEGAPTLLSLPTDRPRPKVQSFHGANQSTLLPAELSAALRGLGQRQGATLFMVLLTAFKLLLRHATGQEDVVVGTDVANRNRAETEPLIGFFVNQLVLRTDLSGDPTFLEVLDRVRRVVLEANAHQDLPFDKLVEALRIARDPDRTPLFQVKLVLQNIPLVPQRFADLEVIPINVHNATAKFDVLFNLTDTEEGLRGTVEYNTDLFDAASIHRFLQRFESLLAAVCTRPEARASALLSQLGDARNESRVAREELKDLRSKLFKTGTRRAVRV